MKRYNVKSNTLQFGFCIFYSSYINLSKTKKPSHRQHQSAGALLSLLQMMSYVTALKFENLKGILFSNPASPEAFATYSINKGEECDNFLLAYRRLYADTYPQSITSLFNCQKYFNLLYHTEHLFVKRFVKIFKLYLTAEVLSSFQKYSEFSVS